MVDAEELGVGQGNVDSMRASERPDIRRLLGLEGNFGEALGLNRDWAYRIVRHVGNYGESFERNLGRDSPLKIERGQNALWTRGGPAIRSADPLKATGRRRLRKMTGQGGGSPVRDEGIKAGVVLLGAGLAGWRGRDEPAPKRGTA